LAAHGKADAETGWTYEDVTHLFRVVVPQNVELFAPYEEELERLK